MNYTTSNLVDETFQNADIDLLYIFDTRGKAVWGGVVLTGAKSPTPWAMVPPKGLSPGHPLLVPHNPDTALSKQNITGVIMNNGIPLLLAARPILTSNNEGPIRGTMIMGNFLDDEMLKSLRKQTQVDFQIITVPGIVVSFDKRSMKGDYSDLPGAGSGSTSGLRRLS